MSPALANFLFEAANFLLLAGALAWLLFKPVRAALERERQRYQTERDEAARLRAEADQLAASARAARDASSRDLDHERAEVVAAARKQAAELLEDARDRRRRERQSLAAELDAMREAEVSTVAENVGRLAADAVRELLASLPGPSLDDALVRAACTELEALPAKARKSAVVESARALDDESRALLQHTLGDEFTERVVDELGAGVRVTTTAGQVDATAVSLARRAAHAVVDLAGPEAHHG